MLHTIRAILSTANTWLTTMSTIATPTGVSDNGTYNTNLLPADTGLALSDTRLAAVSATDTTVHDPAAVSYTDITTTVPASDIAVPIAGRCLSDRLGLWIPRRQSRRLGSLRIS